MGKHSFIIRLLKGVFNSRPPVNKIVPEWNLLIVFQVLKECPFEPMNKAPLKFVMWKTVFLIAITTFRHCGVLQSLTLGEENVSVQKRV